MLLELLSVRSGTYRFTSETILNDLDTFIDFIAMVNQCFIVCFVTIRVLFNFFSLFFLLCVHYFYFFFLYVFIVLSVRLHNKQAVWEAATICPRPCKLTLNLVTRKCPR